MGLGSFVDSLGNAGGKLLDSAERTTGALVNDNAHLVAMGLDEVGLHGAARWTADKGDHFADWLGAHVPEQQLWESDDPRDLLHGDAGRIRGTAGRLRRLHTAFDTGHAGLSRLSVDDWHGEGGDAFRMAFTPQPAAWSHAAASCQQAADALDHYAYTVEWAQRQAAEALRQWQRGVAAHDSAAASHAARVRDYNAAVKAGTSPPAAPGPFTDPGVGDRKAAGELLAAAREQRDTAAHAAQTAMCTAAGLAPDLPSFTERWHARADDLLSTTPIHLEHLAGGLVRAGCDVLRFTRGLDPLDPYNASHPAAYLTRLNATAAGLLDLAARPERLPAALLGTGWGADSDEAAGRLLGVLLLNGLTEGGATVRHGPVGWRDAVKGHGARFEDIRAFLRGGTDGLQPVDPAHQRALERAVPRNRDGSFARYPDPYAGWTKKQNDGGIEVLGRSNNCADAVRAALETWYGNPQVAAARTLTRTADGKLNLLVGERFGVENGNAWGGTAFDYTGRGPAAYHTVADEVRRSGHGSSAFVHIEWPVKEDGERTAHVFTALNHKGRVVWFDPQSGVVSTSPIHLRAHHVFHYVLDADRRPVKHASVLPEQGAPG